MIYIEQLHPLAIGLGAQGEISILLDLLQGGLATQVEDLSSHGCQKLQRWKLKPSLKYESFFQVPQVDEMVNKRLLGIKTNNWHSVTMQQKFF